MGTLSGAYADYSYDYGNRYSQYSSGSSSYGTTARANTTAATRSKLMQTVKDVAQGYSSDLATVEYYLRSGDIDSAIRLKDSVFSDISNTLATEYNFNVSDKQIQSMLDQAYTSINDATLLQTIEENADGSFITGLKESVPIFGLFANGNSKAEAVGKLSGTKTAFKEIAKEGAGMYIPGALAVAGGIAAMAVLPAAAPFIIGAGVVSIGQNIIRSIAS